MGNSRKHLYEFGSFRLDAAERLLLRDAEVVTLTPKAFDLLLTLVNQPGHLLEKEELLKTVWPDSIVEDTSHGHKLNNGFTTKGQRNKGTTSVY